MNVSVVNSLPDDDAGVVYSPDWNAFLDFIEGDCPVCGRHFKVQPIPTGEGIWWCDCGRFCVGPEQKVPFPVVTIDDIRGEG